MRFLVMELVEGETLAERIARGPLPLDEALAIARQIAEALEAAHEQGSCIAISSPPTSRSAPTARVKVLDFGLAKALEPRRARRRASPTIAHVDRRGHDAAGRDPRHGGLHEPRAGAGASRSTSAPTSGPSAACSSRCSTGRRAFVGETIPETLASVLKRAARLERAPRGDAACGAPVSWSGVW